MDKILQIEITAESPLAFPERRIGNRYYRSRDYIPGNALFGALGDDGRFEPALFQHIRVHNAYPMHESDDWVRPLPVTAQQPKSAKTPTIIDTLIYRVCWERQQPTAYVYAPRDVDLRPYESVGSAYYTRDTQVRRVMQRSSTRVSINPHTRTAQDGLLYSFSHLDEWQKRNDRWEPTKFLGSIVFSAENEQRVAELVQSISAIGGRKTSGIGSVSCVLRESTSNIFDQDGTQERVKQFTELFGNVIAANKQLGGNDWPIGGSLFTINLVSDAILMRDGWIPSHTYTAEQLKEDTGIEAELIRSFTQAKVVGGWNTTWRRHRESAVATQAGGVFVFASKTKLDQSAYTRLCQLQLKGIGERCNEGFGQVIVCDPFHHI